MNAPLTPAEVGRRWFEEVWDRRNATAVRELMAPNSIGHLEGGLEAVGAEAFLEFQSSFLSAVPDLRVTVQKVLGDETEACVHWEARGTHSGSAFGMSPTTRPVNFQGVTWLRVENGQIVEGWDFWNQGRIMQIMAGDLSA